MYLNVCSSNAGGHSFNIYLYTSSSGNNKIPYTRREVFLQVILSLDCVQKIRNLLSIKILINMD